MPAQNHVALLPDRDGDIHAGWRYPGGRHWEQARRLNRRVNALSDVLMRLSSRQLLRVRCRGHAAAVRVYYAVPLTHGRGPWWHDQA